MRIPVSLVAAWPLLPECCLQKTGPEGARLFQRWALVRKEQFQAPRRILYIETEKQKSLRKHSTEKSDKNYYQKGNEINTTVK